jgi:tRNA threonylcarbamoyladenosine biosynthesis protein TsaE
MSNLLEIDYQINDIETVANRIIECSDSKTLLFYGEMGVGKTTLIKTLVKLLGSNDEVSSPTFSIVNEYIGEDCSISHFDLFRVATEEEVLNFGFEDYLNNQNWVFIEWPEIAVHLLMEEYHSITMSYKNDNSRTLKLS